jgi:hypothetical protein
MAVEQLNVVLGKQRDLLDRAEKQVQTAREQLSVASATKEIQEDLAVNQSELAKRPISGTGYQTPQAALIRAKVPT